MAETSPLQYQTISFDPDTVNSTIYSVTSFFGLTGGSGNGPDALFATLFFSWQIFAVLALIFSALLLYSIIYTKIKYGELHHTFVHDLLHAEHEYTRLTGKHRVDDKWNEVLSRSNSENPNEWRLAIIEADIMLEDMLEKKGYSGKTIGEKLKGANKETFHTIGDAWEAHKIRNEIAHQGSDFILTKRITNEAIMRYQRVFDEHGTVSGGHH